jgi:hypothetical protein
MSIIIWVFLSQTHGQVTLGSHGLSTECALWYALGTGTVPSSATTKKRLFYK